MGLPSVTAPAPMRAPVSPLADISMQMTDFSWRSTFNGKPKGQEFDGLVVSTGAGAGVMDVPAACKFMADPSLDSVSPADKIAYLTSKGVSAFIIAQAECTAPEDNVQGHP